MILRMRAWRAALRQHVIALGYKNSSLLLYPTVSVCFRNSGWISACFSKSLVDRIERLLMAEVVGMSQPATSVCEWLSSLPLAASAGNAVSNVYEGSKNYNCVTHYALGTVESSIKLAASAMAPVVKSLDKPSMNSITRLVMLLTRAIICSQVRW